MAPALKLADRALQGDVGLLRLDIAAPLGDAQDALGVWHGADRPADLADQVAVAVAGDVQLMAQHVEDVVGLCAIVLANAVDQPFLLRSQVPVLRFELP
ncbi:MAG: hypothetical protein Q8M88_17080 [Phenylobacterium sp.]|uniref:hypothetical protein n=1 Tax=Phenylobacterium sp. TaxID=1871053 RepID=UPI002736DF24|nr:hypothetical protein [Phenylobacterium sp.]MDP3176141.1 hypothetical protein [Phenylobacterium sp.]